MIDVESCTQIIPAQYPDDDLATSGARASSGMLFTQFAQLAISLRKSFRIWQISIYDIEIMIILIYHIALQHV